MVMMDGWPIFPAARASCRKRAEMRALVRAMPDAQDLLAMPRQRLDRAGDMLPARANALLRDKVRRCIDRDRERPTRTQPPQLLV